MPKPWMHLLNSVKKGKG